MSVGDHIFTNCVWDAKVLGQTFVANPFITGTTTATTDNIYVTNGSTNSDFKFATYGDASQELLEKIKRLEDLFFKKVVVKCKWCGQWGAGGCECRHCGQAIDFE
jgi:hypothetical protein